MPKRVWRIFLLILLLAWVSPAGAPASDDNVYIDTIGALSGSYIYMTYGYIGVVADAYSKDLYEAGQIKHMMEEKVTFINKLVQSLRQVQGTNLAQTDREFIEAMIEILDLLKQEAESLAAFATSNDPAEVEHFDQVRQEAWSQIKKVFGVN
ncbi:MAG: hypothetical protein AB1896_07835 [Thermodesulfobacteriota bacterium]